MKDEENKSTDNVEKKRAQEEKPPKSTGPTKEPPPSTKGSQVSEDRGEVRCATLQYYSAISDLILPYSDLSYNTYC